MGNDTKFSVRSAKGGYILMLGDAYGGFRGGESIHPSVDDLVQAIRAELANPTTTPANQLTAGLMQGATTYNATPNHN
jgi:hypothetical protein